MSWYLRAFSNRVDAPTGSKEYDRLSFGRLFLLMLDLDYRLMFSQTIMLTSRQISRNLNGIPTEVVIQAFADRILVLITQVGKVGTLVHLIHQRVRLNNE
jgi:hypothetical protein